MSEHGFSDREAGMILERMDHQDEKLEAILVQTLRTNGRVSSLERWRAWTSGATVVIATAGVPLALLFVHV